MLKVAPFIIGLFFSSFALSKTVSVSVKVDTEYKTQALAQEEAKLLVVKEALFNLPKLIEGAESLIDGEYKSEIKAIAVTYMDTFVTSEVWDRQANTMEMKADVYLDEKKSLMLLDAIKSQREASKDIVLAYNKLDLMLSKPLTKVSLDKAKTELLQLKKNSARLLSLEEALNVIDNEIKHLNSLNDNLIRSWVDTTSLSLITIDKGASIAEFKVSGEKFNEQVSDLATALRKSGSKVSLSEICGVSDYGLHFTKRVPYNSTASSQLLMRDIKFKFNYQNNSDVLSNFYKTFIIRPCN